MQTSWSYRSKFFRVPNSPWENVLLWFTAPLLSPPAWLAGVKITAGFYISFKRLFVSYLSLFEIRAEEKEQMRWELVDSGSARGWLGDRCQCLDGWCGWGTRFFSFLPWGFDLIFVLNYKYVLDSVWTMMLLRFYAIK